MAITITTEEAAVAIRAAGDRANVPDPVLAVISLLLPAAGEIVALYAPRAPTHIMNAAAIRLVGWMYDADPADARSSRALAVSGAGSLLAPWREHRAGPIGDGAAAPSPSPVPGGGGTVPAPPGAGHFILTSNNGALVWVEFPSPS